MLFFKKRTAKYDLDYKLRNILIDYFKSRHGTTNHRRKNYS
jgi:hypothetical protein